MSLSSDNFLLSGDAERAATPTEEVVRLVTVCGFNWHEVAFMLRNGIDGTFVDLCEDEIQAFSAKIEEVLIALGGRG